MSEVVVTGRRSPRPALRRSWFQVVPSLNLFILNGFDFKAENVQRLSIGGGKNQQERKDPQQGYYHETTFVLPVTGSKAGFHGSLVELGTARKVNKGWT